MLVSTGKTSNSDKRDEAKHKLEESRRRTFKHPENISFIAVQGIGCLYASPKPGLNPINPKCHSGSLRGSFEETTTVAHKAGESPNDTAALAADEEAKSGFYTSVHHL